MVRRREPVTLNRKTEPILVDIKIVILMSFLFFIIAFIIGSFFRHYPSLQGVI